MSVKYDITSNNLTTSGYRPIHAGDDYDHQFAAKLNGTPIDLTGSKIWFTIKESSSDLDVDALLQYSSSDDDQIEITNATNGLFTIHLAYDDTASLEGTWLYDIKIKLSSGAHIRLARGVIEFLSNITQAYS